MLSWAPDTDVNLRSLWAYGRICVSLDPSQNYTVLSAGGVFDRTLYFQGAAASLISGTLPMDFFLAKGQKIFIDTGSTTGNSGVLIAFDTVSLTDSQHRE